MLAGSAFRVLFLEGKHRGHAAMPAPTTQPIQDSALEQLGVEPVRLGAPVLAHTAMLVGWITCASTSCGTKPARQPEPVTARLEGNHNALDHAASFGRLVALTLQQLLRRRLVGWKLRERVLLDTRDDPSHEPTQLAYVADRDQRAILCSSVTSDRLRPFSSGMGVLLRSSAVAIMPRSSARPVASAHRLGCRHRPDRRSSADLE